MLQLYSDFTAWMHSEEGQGMVEYALIIALIAIALIVGLRAVSGSISTAFTRINSGLTAP